MIMATRPIQQAADPDRERRIVELQQHYQRQMRREKRESRRRDGSRIHVNPVVAIGSTCLWENPAQAARAIGVSDATMYRRLADRGSVKGRQFIYADRHLRRWMLSHPGEPVTWKIVECVMPELISYRPVVPAELQMRAHYVVCDDGRRWPTTREAAVALGVMRHWVWRAMRDGRLVRGHMLRKVYQ